MNRTFERTIAPHRTRLAPHRSWVRWGLIALLLSLAEDLAP